MSEQRDVITELEKQGTILGHPKGLYLLFFTELWERFSYYGMRAILMLYMTKLYLENGLEIPKDSASLIYGFFTGFVYFTPIIGGWLADKFLGQRNAITIGGITMFLGQLVLFAVNTQVGLAIGLILLIIGNGFFKPNISTLVGRLYRQGDARRDSAFSIFYMGINLGALLAPIVVAILCNDLFATKGIGADGKEVIMSYGYKYGFLAAAVGMLIGQIIFNTLAKKYLLEIGEKPNRSKVVDETVIDQTGVAAETVTTVPVNAPLTTIEKQRMSVIFILTAFIIFFWAGFEQAGSSMTLYTDEYIDRTVGSWTISTELFQSVNPLFIVLLAPLFAWFWGSKMGSRMSTPVKMSLGMILLGIGFLFMLMATGKVQTEIIDGKENVVQKAGLWFLIVTYFFHTIGELCISPVGLSVVTKLAPIKLASMLMGVWMLSTFVANILGGFIAAYVEKLGAALIFSCIGGFVIALGLIMLAVSRKLGKMMHGVK
jgi:POT family proton-dependent oligopeptide transporter